MKYFLIYFLDNKNNDSISIKSLHQTKDQAINNLEKTAINHIKELQGTQQVEKCKIDKLEDLSTNITFKNGLYIHLNETSDNIFLYEKVSDINGTIWRSFTTQINKIGSFTIGEYDFDDTMFLCKCSNQILGKNEPSIINTDNNIDSSQPKQSEKTINNKHAKKNKKDKLNRKNKTNQNNLEIKKNIPTAPSNIKIIKKNIQTSPSKIVKENNSAENIVNEAVVKNYTVLNEIKQIIANGDLKSILRKTHKTSNIDEIKILSEQIIEASDNIKLEKPEQINMNHTIEYIPIPSTPILNIIAHSTHEQKIFELVFDSDPELLNSTINELHNSMPDLEGSDEGKGEEIDSIKNLDIEQGNPECTFYVSSIKMDENHL